MRLIGQCPACGKEDECVRVEPREGGIVRVTCRSCAQLWPSVPDAVAEAVLKGHRLVSLSIERDFHRVIVAQPLKDDVPYGDLVVLALNRALRIGFGLDKCHAAESGVAGMYQGEPIELRNAGEWIGLEDEHRFAEALGDPTASEHCGEVLGQYQLLLWKLFGEEELFVGHKLTRGTILKLHARDPHREEKVKFLLWCVIQQCAGGKVVDGVFRELGWQVSRAALEFYVPGMSEKEIAERFWLLESAAQASQ